MCLPLDVGIAAAMVDAVDNISTSILLVDGERRIVHANAPARLLLAAGDVLCTAAGRLATTDAGTNRMFQDALARCPDRTMPADGGIIALPLAARDGTRYVARVLELTAAARRRSGMSYAATSVVFVNEVVLDARSLPGIVAKAFKLTPTELRILFLVLGAGGVRGAAESLGIAVSTVKTHLSRVFEKTGTSRQADLAMLVAGFSNSLLR